MTKRNYKGIEIRTVGVSNYVQFESSDMPRQFRTIEDAKAAIRKHLGN